MEVKVLTITLCLLVLGQVAFAQSKPPRRPVPRMEEERSSDPPAALVWRLGSSPRTISTFNNFTSYQVNVDGNHNNIVGDAANEPSLTVNPLDHSRMSIGWRQFNNVSSNFRQGGFAYTTTGGTLWSFQGALTSGFRSDPVLMTDS